MASPSQILVMLDCLQDRLEEYSPAAAGFLNQAHEALAKRVHYARDRV
jgi:hypothetical protein